MQLDHFRHHSRLNKPYLVLVEPDSGRAAAYDAAEQLLTEQASGELVRFALQRHVHSETLDDMHPWTAERRLPSWATERALRNCRLYWLRDGWSKFRDLLETPDA